MADAQGEAGGLKSALHIFILSSLALSQPLFEQLGMNPEFFIIRRHETADILAITVLISIVIPGILILLAWLFSKLFPGWKQAIYALLLFVIFSCFVLIPLNRTWKLAWPFAFLIAFFVSGLLVLGYRRYGSIRMFIGFLFPALLVVPGLFLTNHSISRLVIKKQVSLPKINVPSSTPVVLVVFDEFPLSSILKDQKTIDEEHFPNLAALTKSTTWFRNATTVCDFTSYAVPAILDGIFPKTEDLPVIEDHPENLFTALGTSYELVVFESGENLLPKQFYRMKVSEEWWRRTQSMLVDLALLYGHMLLPSDLGSRWLPPVDQAWGNFWGTDKGAMQEDEDRLTKFNSFLGSLGKSSKPALYYIHSMLPHGPWEYLPNGEHKVCTLSEQSGNYNVGFLECHLYQVGLADRLVGLLIDRLKSVGLYDKCLLVITADHGASFQTGKAHRALRTNNYQDILLVPLFIKKPFQNTGDINDLNANTTDVLPTIAEVLRVHLPWTKGISLLDPSATNRPSKSFFSAVTHKVMTFGPFVQADPETLNACSSILSKSPYWQTKAVEKASPPQ